MSDRHWSAERCEVASAYPGKKWREKVLNMSDAQVHATYISIRNRKESGKKCDKSACKSVTV